MCCAVIFFSENLCESFLSLSAVRLLCMDVQPSWKARALGSSQLHRRIDTCLGFLIWHVTFWPTFVTSDLLKSTSSLSQTLGAVGRTKYYWPFPLVSFWGFGGRAQLILHVGGDSGDFTSPTCVHAYVCNDLKRKKKSLLFGRCRALLY